MSRYNPMRPQSQLAPSAAPKLKTACPSSGASCNIPNLNNSAANLLHPMSLSSSIGNTANASALKMNNTPKQAHLYNTSHQIGDLHQNFGCLINNVINGLSAASLANLISQIPMNQLQYLQPNINGTITNDVTNLSAKFPSSLGSTPSYLSNHVAQRPPFDSTTLRLLESLYAMNDDPEEEAIDMIAQRINSTTTDVGNWFQTRRAADRNQFLHFNSPINLVSQKFANAGCVSSLDDSKSHMSNIHHRPDQNITNQAMLNYSHLRQSILESVLGSSNARSPANGSDVRPVTLDHSENGSHPETFNESEDEEELAVDLKSSNLVQRDAAQIMHSSNTTSDLINFYASNPFLSLIGPNKTHMLPISDSSAALVGSGVAAFKAQPPTAPSSTLLSKLSAVTSRPNAHILTTKLDHKMVDLLEAFYAINDNPEPAAIEMIARRINTTAEVLGDWFDEKRIQVNPHAGPRSPPAKKREGGRVVTFSEYQRSLLEAIFDENNYLHPQEYEELSNLIQVPSRNIKIWFKNRRSKQRLSGRITTPGSVNNSD